MAGVIINAKHVFDKRRERGFVQIQEHMALQAACQASYIQGLESIATSMISDFRQKGNAMLLPYRLELAPLARGYDKDTPVMELLYYFADIPGIENQIARNFVRDHHAEILEAIAIYDDGIAELRDWLHLQHWPIGYDINKHSHAWHVYSYGWKISIMRLIQQSRHNAP